MGKGEDLNKRVWRLFSAAGFVTVPNSDDPTEKEITIEGKSRTIDLWATEKELGVKIIGWNKAQRTLGEPFTSYINDYQVLKKKLSASAAVFISTGAEPTEADKDYAISQGDRIWGEAELSYYEAIVAAIGVWGKYEIIHSLGITTREEKGTHVVQAIKINQPDKDSQAELFLFCISPDKLLKTCAIYRRAQGDAAAYQRMLQGKRLPKIGAFLGRDDALLPTNIVLHLSERVNVRAIKGMAKPYDVSGRPINFSRDDASYVALEIPLEYASLEIIDGQHRIFGFTKTTSVVRNKFNVVVVGIRDMLPKQRRDSFIAINDNARKMDPNLVAYLKYTSDEAECQASTELMAIHVAVELNKNTPFKGGIRLLDIGNQHLTLKGVAGYDLKGLLSPHGLLRKYYPNHRSHEYEAALRLYFQTVRFVFKKEWDAPDKFIISTNRGVSAFFKLLKSILKNIDGPLDHDKVKSYLKPLRANFGTWETKKLQANYVGSQGWKSFHRDMTKAIRKTMPTFRD